MTNKLEIKMIKAFGSSISEQILPDDLVKDFLADLKMIRALPDKERENHLLAPQFKHEVEAEYLITPKVLEKYNPFFNACVHGYCQLIYPNLKKLEKVYVDSAWYSVQKINQINSLHHHSSYPAMQSKQFPQISCVGYLQIPKMSPPSPSSNHHNISGNIEFFEGSLNYFSSSSFKKIPWTKLLMIFPSHLAHWVYPFYSKDKNAERISFSANIGVEYEYI